MSSHNVGRNQPPSVRWSTQPEAVAIHRPDHEPRLPARPRGGTPLTAATDRSMLIDRLQTLRLLLPAMADETAKVRRDNARLRNEAKKLTVRVAELEAQVSGRTR
jgi:hypothetical protein